MRILTLPFFAVLLTVGSVLGQPPPQPPPPHGGAGVFIQRALGLGGSYLGVGLLEIDEDRAADLGLGEPYGVEISNVAPDSPAERAGIEKADAILEYAGQRVMGIEHFVRLVKETPAGREIKLSMLREGSELDLQATIGERKHRPPYRSWFCDEDEPGCEFRVPGFDWDWRGFGFDLPRPHMVIREPFPWGGSGIGRGTTRGIFRCRKRAAGSFRGAKHTWRAGPTQGGRHHRRARRQAGRGRG